MNKTTAVAAPSVMPLYTGTISSAGGSKEAVYIDAETEKQRTKIQESYTLGFVGKGTYDALFDVAEESAEANWDGYEAEPVTAETFQAAYRFLEALPLGTPAPALSAEPDGYVSMEWYRSPRQVLAVSVGPDCDVSFSGSPTWPKQANWPSSIYW